MHRSRRPKLIVRLSLTILFLILALMIAGLPAQARAKCDPAAVWLTLPDSSQVAGVNKQLMTDSGPTVNHHTQTTTYSRRWQGAGSSRSLSITIIIHPTAKVTADSVKSYGESLLKSNNGQKVSLGNLGYRTNQIKRPYFMVHKGRFVVTYYTSYPGRSGGIPNIPTEEQTIREILSKIAVLPCFSSTNQPPPPPPNNCPQVKLSFSPTQPLPTDTIILVAKATDADGDKLTYDWYIRDFNNIRILTNKKAGSRLTWQPPGPGQYRAKVIVYDGQCGDNSMISIRVFTDPNRANQPPVIRLSVKPNPAQVGQMIVFTATVNDPEGDSITSPKWTPHTYPVTRALEKRVGNTFTYRGKFPAGVIVNRFVAADVRGAWAKAKMIQVVVTDPSQLLNVKLSCDNPSGKMCGVQEGGRIMFTAVANNPKQEPLTYAWSIDGKRKKNWQGAQVVWDNIPFRHKDYKITVQVWKKNGETARGSIDVDVIQAPPPPTVNSKPKVSLICLTANPQKGKPVSFKATASDADAGDKLTWKWSLDGKAVGWSSLRPSWNNPTAGKHSVKITVSDGTDKVSATRVFTVQAPVPPPPPPPPPPVTTTIIQSAEFVDSATSSVWGSSPKSQWQAGEEINLRIDIKPVNRSHNLEIIWRDAAGKLQKRDLAAVSASGAWSRGETIWSSFRSTANDVVGTWTVDILVDGRLDRTLTFRLDRRKRSISPRQPPRPPQQSGSRPSNRPVPSTPRPGTGGTPQPSSTWKSVF